MGLIVGLLIIAGAILIAWGLLALPSDVAVATVIMLGMELWALPLAARLDRDE